MKTTCICTYMKNYGDARQLIIRIESICTGNTRHLYVSSNKISNRIHQNTCSKGYRGANVYLLQNSYLRA